MKSSNFDKILLTTVLLLFIGLVVYTAATKNDDTTNWARENASLVLGGLLGIITGAGAERLRALTDSPKPSQELQPPEAK